MKDTRKSWSEETENVYTHITRENQSAANSASNYPKFSRQFSENLSIIHPSSKYCLHMVVGDAQLLGALVSLVWFPPGGHARPLGSSRNYTPAQKGPLMNVSWAASLAAALLLTGRAESKR